MMRTYLRQLFGNVSTDEDSLQVDPQVLDSQPILDDVRRVGQLLHPQLDLLLERHVIPEGGQLVDTTYSVQQRPKHELHVSKDLTASLSALSLAHVAICQDFFAVTGNDTHFAL